MSDKPSKLGPRDEAMLAQFATMKARLERQKGSVQWRPMQSVGGDGVPNFDLSVADPDCEHCEGKGYRMEIFETNGEPDTATIICRCVDRNGGIRREQIPGASPIAGAPNHGAN